MTDVRARSGLRRRFSRGMLLFMAMMILVVASAPVFAAARCTGICGQAAHPMMASDVAAAHAAVAPLEDGGTTPSAADCSLDCCTLCAPVLIAAPSLPAAEGVGLVLFTMPAHPANSIYSTPTSPPPRLSA